MAPRSVHFQEIGGKKMASFRCTMFDDAITRFNVSLKLVFLFPVITAFGNWYTTFGWDPGTSSGHDGLTA